jgi:hypothetical protein
MTQRRSVLLMRGTARFVPGFSTLAQRFAALCSLAAMSAGVGACDEDLGACDEAAANELVYGRSGLVATKGQALTHDSCGQGSTCHSSAAKGESKHGVPADLLFDMLPRPTGVNRILSQRDNMWDSVTSGQMPPKEYAVGDGDWRFDVDRLGMEKLPALSTDEGKGILRNWLACGAPVVVDTKIPSWSTKPAPVAATPSSEWTGLHQDLRLHCSNGSCHNGSPSQATPPGWLTLPEGNARPAQTDAGAALSSGQISVPFGAGECEVYRWLMYGRDVCQQRLVVGSDPSASGLVDKLENATPLCGAPMPPAEPMEASDKASRAIAMQALTKRIKDWIGQGALAPQCGEWSDLAPRADDVSGGQAPQAPDWAQLHSQIIGPRCANAGCHDAAGAKLSGKLDLTEACAARRALLEDSGDCGGVRVVPGDTSSMLIDKVASEKPRCKTRMPPGAPLSAQDIKQLRDWVQAGALAADCP